MRRFTAFLAAGLVCGCVTAWVLQLSFAAPAASVAKKAPELGVGGSLNGYRVFSPDDAWNMDVSKSAVDPDSDAIIKEIGVDKPLHPDFGASKGGGRSSGAGIPYVVVGKDQKKVPIKFTRYAGDSDPGPYPIPLDAPIEGGGHDGGDDHVLVLDRDAQILYELYQGVPSGDGWSASCGAISDLKKPSTQRPAGWTSCDAAGLPIFPGLARYDEIVEEKLLTHALRFTVRRSRRAYIPPARHQAGRSTDKTYPPMGMRVRLKDDFDISGYPPAAKVILQGLKTYGLILADNGSDWYITGAPDSRWDNSALQSLGKVKGKDLEVIKMDGLVGR